MSQALGEGAQAAARVQASLDDSAETDPYTNARVRNALCNHHLASGDLSALKEVAEQAREDATALGQGLTLAWAHYLLGRVYYEWNELAEAEAHFMAVCALRHKCHFMLLRNAMQGLTLTQQARGQPEAAAETLATLGDWVAQLQDSGQAAIERAFTVGWPCSAGVRLAEPNWLPPSEPPGPREGVLAVEDPRTTRIRALLSQGTEVALRQATADGAALLARYEAKHNWLQVVEALGLQALAHQALGASSVALDELERALRLAEPAGRVRVFVDLGAPMARLLALYAARRGTSPTSSGCSPPAGPRPRRGRPRRRTGRRQPFPMVEPLTRREMEVLQRLQAAPDERRDCSGAVRLGRHGQETHQKPLPEAPGRRTTPRRGAGYRAGAAATFPRAGADRLRVCLAPPSAPAVAPDRQSPGSRFDAGSRPLRYPKITPWRVPHAKYAAAMLTLAANTQCLVAHGVVRGGPDSSTGGGRHVASARRRVRARSSTSWQG